MLSYLLIQFESLFFFFLLSILFLLDLVIAWSSLVPLVTFSWKLITVFNIVIVVIVVRGVWLDLRILSYWEFSDSVLSHIRSPVRACSVSIRRDQVVGD